MEIILTGSVLAAILIVVGLYLILWGKAKETKRKNQLASLESVQELPVSNPHSTTCSPQNNKLTSTSPTPRVLEAPMNL